MISAALGQEEPAQPVCRGALLSVWSLITADQASISSIALRACRSSGVMYQAMRNRPAGTNNLFVAWETLTHGDNTA
jgi:hypothetical protein